MTARDVVAPAAERDISEIGSFIEKSNPAVASAVVAAIYDAFSPLAEQPAIGHRRQDLTHFPVRFWTVRGRYLVVYREGAATIEIARVLNAYRDIASIMEQSEG